MTRRGTTRTLVTDICLTLLLLGVAQMGSAMALSVRVEIKNGVPRLVVDGRPVRARMFFGIPGSAPLAVLAGPRKVSFEFQPNASCDSATMHFRFGNKPGSIDLDDIQVVDLEDHRDVIPRCEFEAGQESFSGSWTTWPPGQQNNVGRVEVKAGCGNEGSAGLHVELKAPANGQWPDFHIYHLSNLRLTRGHRYRATFWAGAHPERELTVAFYKPGTTYTHLGGPPGPFESQIRMAAEAGVNFVSFPVELPWPKPGQPEDWTSVDLACEQVLAANPRALLLPRIGMTPPEWWQADHEDEVMQWENGRRGLAVVASPIYRRDAARQLTALVTHLESRFGEHVAGYHPCGQNTGEWFYEGTWESPLSGYAPADRRAWQDWLKNRYRTDSGLRSAWHDSSISLGTALVPSPALRHGAPAGVFRDPAREQALIDWAEFQQQAMSQCVCDLAHAVRQASRGRKLVVFFYGYVFEFAAAPNGPSVAGHYALRRVLDSPDIDVLCSPISYFDRGLGQSAPSMTAAESVALAGKLWLNEDDTRTYLGTGDFPGAADAVSTLEDTNRELIRNVGQEAVRNFGTWWMDLGATGWFNDPRMWREMTRLKEIDEPLLERPSAYCPEVAAVIDERAMRELAAGSNLVSTPGIYQVRAGLGRMGAPYGQYLLDDVVAGRVHAKLFVMLNAWRLSKQERAALSARLRGSTVIWCYAPGYLDGDRFSLAAMRELTGFELGRCSADKAMAAPTAAGARLGLRQPIGTDQRVRPLFSAGGLASDEVLATYPDGSAAVARRRSGDGASFFVGAPGLTTELLRVAASESGVHVYTDSDCNVYARDRFLVLHAAKDGPITVTLPARTGHFDQGSDWVISDALTGEPVGHGPKIRLVLKRGDTRILCDAGHAY